VAEEEVQDRKDGTERRVYNLPASLLARLRAYQISQAIPSEAEAARRLLDYALQLRDTVFNILQTLDARYAEERDLRVLASDILTKHTLVTHVEFEESAVNFTLRNQTRGRIEENGALKFQEQNDDSDYWRPYYKVKGKFSEKSPTAAPSRGTTAPPWEPAGGDLDDEIPF
jgi:hypothetical protein